MTFERLFGLGADGRRRYEIDVRQRRYPLLWRFRKSAKPQAIVCFGKGWWSEYRRALEIQTEYSQLELAEKVECYPDQHVVLAPFFGYWHMNPRIANTIARILNSWGVVIP
jgi:hypothetical protein